MRIKRTRNRRATHDGHFAAAPVRARAERILQWAGSRTSRLVPAPEGNHQLFQNLLAHRADFVLAALRAVRAVGGVLAQRRHQASYLFDFVRGEISHNLIPWLWRTSSTRSHAAVER